MRYTVTTLLFSAALFGCPFHVFGQWHQTNGPEGGTISILVRHHNTIWAGSSGLYFSTDEGETWVPHQAFDRTHAVLSVHNHNDALFALVRAAGVGPQGYENHIYRSLDAGQTWAFISKIPFSLVFSVYRFATIRDYLLLMHTSKAYRSADNGQTWQEVAFPIEIPTNLVYDSAMLMTRSYPQGIFISDDVGDTWHQITDSAALFTHIHCARDSMIIAENYSNGSHQYVITQNLGQTWEPLMLPPLTPPYGVQFYTGPGDTLFCRDKYLYWTTDLGATWHYWGNTTAERYAISPWIYLSDGALGYRSDGVWRYRTDTDDWVPSNKGLRNAFVHQLFGNDHVLFASTSSGLFGTVDAGLHWNALPIPPSEVGYSFALSGDTLFVMTYNTLFVYPYNSPGGWDTLAPNVGNGSGSTAAFSLQGDKLVWIGSSSIVLADRYTGDKDFLPLPAGASTSNHFLHIIDGRYIYSDNSGSVYVSDNNGSTWTKTLEQGIPGNNRDNNFFYALGRHFLSNRNGLRISTDKGSSWSDLIPNSPKSAVAIKALGSLLFLTAGNLGVLISQDSGWTWQPYNTGLFTFSGRDLCVWQDQIFWGTVNNSVWRREPNLMLVSGTVYNDANNNGLRDWGEAPFPQVVVQARPNGLYAVSRTDGIYHLYTNSDADTLGVVPFSPYITVNPAFRLASQGGSADFGIHAQPDIHDLEVSVVNLQPFKPGFPTSLVVTCRNNGTVPLRPLLHVTFQPPCQFIHADIYPDSIAGPSTYFWKLDTLPPYKTWRTYILGYVPSSAAIGDGIAVAAQLEPVSTDATPADNTVLLQTAVVGAYDPNDKQASPAEQITPAQIAAGEPIVYTIRFQNTGNYPAVFVRILDTLSTAFDISSLRVLSASHDFTWSLRGTNVLEFFFDDIQLPDSTSHPLASNGYVQYSIRARPDLPLGTSLRNRAFIYFDFNLPVETNTTNTLVAWPTVVSQAQPVLPLRIAPNPATHQVAITRDREHPALLRLLDINAREVRQTWISGTTVRLLVTDLVPGVYQLLLSNGEVVERGQFVIHR